MNNLNSSSMYQIYPGEVKNFLEMRKSDGFSGKTYATAHLCQENEALSNIAKKFLPKDVEVLNTNSTGFKGNLLRRFLEFYNIDRFIDHVLNEFYVLGNKSTEKIDCVALAKKTGTSLPKKFQKKLLSKTNNVSVYLEDLVLHFPIPDILQDEIETERIRMMKTYGNKINYKLRSAATKGEDEGVKGVRSSINKRLIKANKKIAKLQLGKMGAGQHESYPDTEFFKPEQKFSTKESCVTAFHHVWASTYSFQAVGDYYRKIDENGNWFHSGVDMDVIFMPYFHSEKGCAALGFSDVIDNITEITFGANAKGPELVEGKKEFPMINTYRHSNGDIYAATVSGGYVSPENISITKAIAACTHYLESKFAPTEEKIRAINKEEKFVVDSEIIGGKLWKGAKKRYLSLVQYRTFRPGQIARETDSQKLYEVIKNHEKLRGLKPIATGTNIGEMCSVGEVLWIKDKNHLKNADVAGKILIVKEAYAELLGTISAGAKGWIVIPKALKAHATLNGEGEIMQLQGVLESMLRQLKNGQLISVLLNDLYLGDLSDCFKEFEFDLSKQETLDNIVMSVVEGNVSGSRRRKLFPYFRLGILKHNALLRLEAINWNGGVPALFNWVYFDKIKPNDKSKDAIDEAKFVKKYIQDAMKTYETTDAVDAYQKRLVDVSFPLVSFFKYFDQNCEIRLYGARLEEDTPCVDFAFPHEPNPIIGFNGAAMYATEWGRIAATISLKVLKELEKYELENSSIFIPNVVNMGVVVDIVEEAISLGLDVRKRGIKIMVENAVSFTGRFIDEPFLVFNEETFEMDKKAPSFIEYREELENKLGGSVSCSISYGFNDLGNSYTGGDIRHCELPDRSYMSTSYFLSDLEKCTKRAQKYHIEVGNCGLGETGVLATMLQAGASKIGVPVGLSTIKAVEKLTRIQAKLKS